MILIIDIGTSSLRAALMDETGEALHAEQRKYSVQMLENGGVQMDLALLDQALDDALDATGQWLRSEGRHVQMISVTAQRSSVIPVDRQGAALAQALMWQDRRAAGICRDLKDRESELFQICGLRLSPVFSAPKMRLLQQMLPSVFDEAYKLIGFQEYVLCRLCGELVTDETIASRTCLYDLKEQVWSDRSLQLFGLSKEKLCRLVPAGSVIGVTRPNITRLLGEEHPVQVLSAGGDQQCAALGQGAAIPGSLAVNSGTGAYVVALIDKVFIDPQMRVNCNAAATPQHWILEGSVLSAGRTVEWFYRTFFPQSQDRYPYEQLENLLEDSVCGAHQLLFRNALTGIGTPDWEPQERASFLGVSAHHTLSDFSRAVFEGIAADVAGCVELLQTLTPNPCRTIRCAGGLTRFELYNQILSDMLGLPVERALNPEATGRGAWISAATALGWFASHAQACDAFSIPLKRYEPDAQRHALYLEQRQRLKALTEH